MVAVLTGFLAIFRDAGLGAVTVQRLEVTHEQISTLFWINVAVGLVLATLTAILAPVLVSFYREPRLYPITVVSGAAFLFSALAAQHQALILREMQFVTLAKIDLLSLSISSTLGIVMATLGWHYWSLVAMAVLAPMVSAAGVWIAVPWIPGPPRRRCGVMSMLHFGWMATCQGLLVFICFSIDNILIGRFWGANELGLYGRAYQLATLPVQQLTGALSGVAFSAFSRIQDDGGRLTKSFLRAYSFLASFTIPIAISCPLFADEIIRIVLGAKWMEAAPIFRLLAPAALAFAIAIPLSWLVMSTGRVGRALSISAMAAPVVVIGVLAGLNHGPKGVALGYSVAMVLLIIPIIAWSKQGTGITWTDLWSATRASILAGLVALVVGLIVAITLGDILPPILYVFLGIGLMFGVYTWVLLVMMGQKALYLDLLNQVLRRSLPNSTGA
jgi:PST family polysaccharide transporter